MTEKYRPMAHIEARTGSDQMVSITCFENRAEQIKSVVKEIDSIRIPGESTTYIEHGGLGSYSRYQITQHKYAGGSYGYAEVLEIKNPPDGRCGNIVHNFRCGYDGHIFHEFDNMENAIGSWSSLWSNSNLKGVKGLVRSVPCQGFIPWFYAVGDHRKFDEPYPRYGRPKRVFRLVFWDDGTTFDEYRDSCKPRPITERELWIQEAFDKFRKLIAGQSTDFTIDFLDGSKFVGRFIPKNKKSRHAEGYYNVKLTKKDGKKIYCGRVD
jgi:hypothetical protein